MNFTLPRKLLSIPLIVLSGLACLVMPVGADDTEIFSGGSGRPKVLIIFDNSVSMDDPVVGDEASRTRLEVAQEVITSLISTNQDIDFGLATFNTNREPDDVEDARYDGGRIISRIITDMSPDERSNLVDIVDGLSAFGSTPLCESTYEVYRYLVGDEVLFGKQADPDIDLPERDTEAEAGDDYISPLPECGNVYVILMTDGLPRYDDAANESIEELTGKQCREWRYQNPSDTFLCGGPEGEDSIFCPKQENCLPELAEYMATTDLDGDDSNGDQFAITSTVGFATNQTLLQETASLGGGAYYTAESADELTVALADAILNIRFLADDTTFTSPAVAVDTFTRTQSRNEIYYAMFKPDERVDWRGNIKKLTLGDPDDDGVDGLLIVDKNGDAAIDPLTGFIKGEADTYWSSDDGGVVDKGGVGELLINRDPGTRTILIDTGTNGALEAFNDSNITPDAFGLDTAEELYDYFGPEDRVLSEAEFDAAIAYGQGYGVDPDNLSSTGSAREWIMGDPLHSQPVIVDYGALGSFDQDNPDLRVMVGTNGGFLHMFGNDDGEEDWAFFPKELAPILTLRRENGFASQHVYGLDLTPVVYTDDVNGDGTLLSSDGDKVWVFQGMRRGGRDLYALDVSNPSSPRFLWRRSGLETVACGTEPCDPLPEISELGFTWSSPIVTRIPGYADDDGVAKPVLVVGAGYDENKDSAGVGTDDTMGRGVFILDAATGAVIRSITPAAGSATNLNVPGLVDSVPAKVSLLDSNGDDLADRMYFTDTGANIWRVDIGSSLPESVSDESWRVVKFAELAAAGAANDRRFFNAVDIVRIRDNDQQALDVIMVGSGDRANPLGTDVNNAFYLLRDAQTAPYTTDAPDPGSAECDPVDNAFVDFRCFLPLGSDDPDDPGHLFDITNNVLNVGTDEELAIAVPALNVASGWKLRLEGAGEKSLSDSITVLGKVAFTTFTPATVSEDANTCEPQSGLGKLYIVDIYDGERDFVTLGPIIPDTPSVIVIDGEISFVLPPGTPDDGDGDGDSDPSLCPGGVCNIGTFPAPFGNYWYREDY